MERLSQFLSQTKQRYYIMMPKITAYFRQYRHEIILGMLFFIVATVSFALGFLIHKEFQSAQIIIQKVSE